MAAQAGGSNDPSCVLRAVDEGQSADQVRQVIDDYAQRSDERRKAVVNHKNNNETPIEAAHRRRDGPVVGVLLESGADAYAIGPYCHPLALTIHYGLIDTMRVLLRSGWHDANEGIAYDFYRTLAGDRFGTFFCRPVHLAVAPLKRSHNDHQPPPQLEILEVLVREFRADVNGNATSGSTPLFYLTSVPREHRLRALDALVALGADVNRRAALGSTPLHTAARYDDALVQRFLEHGASPDVLNTYNQSALMQACRSSNPSAQGAVSALLRASSAETRRAVSSQGRSAIDYLVEHHGTDEIWCQEAITQLLSSGAPVRRNNAPRVLPIAARLGERRAAELAAVERSVGTTWREHERFVNLAFDFYDLRAAEEGVRRREARVAELEEELRALGVGTEDTDEDDETEEEDDEGGKAATAAGGSA